MEFQCQKSDLVRGVQAVERAVASKNTIQVLTGIHMRVNDEGLILTGTDLELGIEARVPVQVQSSGEIVVEARYFSAIVRRLPEALVSVRYDAQSHRVNVKAGKASFSILTMPPQDFPALPEVADRTEVEIGQVELAEMISQTLFAVSKEDIRPILMGALLEVEDREARMIATDANRLALRRLKLPTPVGEKVRAVIPGRALSEVGKLLTGGEEKVRIRLGDSQAMFQLPGATVVTRLIEGEYPDYRQVIPKEFNTRLKIERKPLMEALERAGVIAKDGPAIVMLTVEQGILSLRAQESEVGQVEEHLEIEQDGDPVNVAFRATFILDMLKVCGQQVELALNGTISPGRLRPVDDSNFVYVVMPVRVTA